MTLQQIIDLRTNFLKFDLDSLYGESETTQNQVDSVNWAMRLISRRIYQYDPKVALTLAGLQQTYDLMNRLGAVVSKRVLRPVRVIVNGLQLRGYGGRHGLYTLEQLEEWSPLWRTASAGTPVAAVHYGETLLLHPAPTADVAASANSFISGQVLIDDMTVDQVSEAPDLPVVLHEAVAFCAAVKSATPNVTEGEGWQRLAAFGKEWQDAAAEIRDENLRRVREIGSEGLAFGELRWV